jgi:hypothetical protein
VNFQNSEFCGVTKYPGVRVETMGEKWADEVLLKMDDKLDQVF